MCDTIRGYAGWLDLMNTATLEREIRAYQAMLPDIVREHGSVWAVVAHERLVKTFRDFSDAARFVDANYRNTDVLIRHTHAVQDSAPFLAVFR